MPKMKLQHWAKEMGISRHTAHNWFVAGKLPYPAERISERIVLIDVPDTAERRETVAYIRVSTRKQVDLLTTQRARVLEYCALNGIKVDRVVEEVGSGLNDNRKKLNAILADPAIGQIVVEHRDRLARLNFNLIESALKAQLRSIIVIEEGEVEDDLVRDMTEILTSFCARLYGRRGAAGRARAALVKAGDEPC